MKYFKFVLLFFFIVNIFFGNANELKEGYWKGELKLEENNTLNFVFFINKKQRITIQNAQERILLKEAIPKNDSLFLSFLSFPG